MSQLELGDYKQKACATNQVHGVVGMNQAWRVYVLI